MENQQFYENVDVTEEPSVAFTKEETDKKCPACDGTMDFDPASGQLVCPYCGTTVAIEKEDEMPHSAEELSFYEATERGSCDWGAEKKVVICKNCAAETVYDALETAGECPYCGSNQVMEAQDENTLAPGGICPFSVDAKRAEDNFRIWIKRKWFCPSRVKKNAGRVTMNGIYLPYWTFDTMTDSSYTARYGIVHTRTVGSGKNRRTETYTKWYRTSGTHAEFFNDRLVNGSRRHDATILAKIEPFDTESNIVYKPEYLAGFAAERYSVGLEDAWGFAKSSIGRSLESSISSEIRRRHHADRVADLSVYTAYHDITYKYLMLPVWMSHFEYNGKQFRFMVNGQTGKVGGKTPISPWRVLIAVLLALGFFALVAVLVFFSEGDVSLMIDLT